MHARHDAFCAFVTFVSAFHFSFLPIQVVSDEFCLSFVVPEQIIAEMNTAGYDVHNTNKVVKKGIDNIKTFGVFCQEDKQIMKEYENYKWKKIGDQIMDEPVKLYDDAMDAIRYATTYIRQEYYTDDSYYAF